MRAADELTIYVDGASRGNPGPSSLGAEIRGSDGAVLRTLSEPIGTATNNIAEYFALIYALEEAVAMRAKKVNVFTDSELMARQFSGRYKVKEPTIRLLYLIVKRLSARFKHCNVTHVPREENKAADRLANEALDGSSLI